MLFSFPEKLLFLQTLTLPYFSKFYFDGLHYFPDDFMTFLLAPFILLDWIFDSEFKMKEALPFAFYSTLWWALLIYSGSFRISIRIPKFFRRTNSFLFGFCPFVALIVSFFARKSFFDFAYVLAFANLMSISNPHCHDFCRASMIIIMSFPYYFYYFWLILTFKEFRLYFRPAQN